MTDLSRGPLPPAENYQYDPAPPREPIGWKGTLVISAFLLGLFAWLVLK